MPNQPIRSYKKNPEPELVLTEQELNSDPTSSEGWKKKGIYQLRNMKDSITAIRSLKQAIELDSKNIDAYVRLGEAFNQAGQ